MPDNPGRPVARDSVAGLRSRSAALRQAAANPRAGQQALLDAALAELDAAIDALSAAGNGNSGPGQVDQPSGLHSERRLLQAVFGQAPMPLFVIDGEGTVRRANSAACELLGVGPGYATGKTLISMIEPAGQAPLRSQLAAVIRTGKPASVTCSVLTDLGTVSCELAIRQLSIRGDDDRLLVTASPDGSASGKRGSGAGRSRPGGKTARAGDQEIAVLTRRTDLLATAARLLLDNAAASESVMLQRCARLLAAELATWVIVDVRRRGVLARHFVAGPEDHTSARLAQTVSAVAPGPGSAPFQAGESGSSLLVTHAEDEEILGRDPAGTSLAGMLGAASVLAVPVAEGTRRFGSLTLVRDAAAGHFGLADAGLAEQVADLLARAISARRMLTRQTETAAALRSSLLPPVLKAVPGVDIAAVHMPPTRGREVGGDFYDVYPTPAGWGVAIGDVCGKGDDAAAATATARHAIRVLSHWNADPAQVLRGANDIMLTEEYGGRFVTADAAHLSWQDRTLRVVLGSAGHPGPVLLKPDGRAQLLAGGGVALGIFPDPEPATQELELGLGDVLFFFTDGLTGARSPQLTYLEDILVDALAALAGRPAADIVAEMRKVVLDFSEGVLLDDLTMLALRAGVPPGA
jgi:serine phosphatase RsbU (regulator of sigma subunit)/PAS domain-containing protein